RRLRRLSPRHLSLRGAAVPHLRRSLRGAPMGDRASRGPERAEEEGMTTPDIVPTADAVAPDGPPPLLVLDRVEAFLDEHGLGRGPLRAQRIGEGQSNVTFLITRGEDRFVLRRGPRPPLPPSTHDMMRESRLLQALAKTDVPVPEVLAVCPDTELLGVPFYVMEYLDGTVITDTLPAYLEIGRAHV